MGRVGWRGAQGSASGPLRSWPGPVHCPHVLSPGRGGSPSLPAQLRSCRTSSAWTSRSASPASWPSSTTTCRPLRESASSGPGQRRSLCRGQLPAPQPVGREALALLLTIVHTRSERSMLRGLSLPFWRVGVMNGSSFNYCREVTECVGLRTQILVSHSFMK